MSESKSDRVTLARLQAGASDRRCMHCRRQLARSHEEPYGTGSYQVYLPRVYYYIKLVPPSPYYSTRL